MNKVRLALAGALVLGLTAVARADEGEGGKSDLQKKLVGKWEVVKFKGKGPEDKGLPPGTPVEFTRDGKVIVTVEEKGEKVRREATYKVEGKGFTLTVKHGDKEETQTIKVVKADDKGLVLRNEKHGHEVTLKKKGKKED